VLAEVGEVVEGIESEHGPPLCALDGEEASGGWRCALEGNKPLYDRQHTYDINLIRTLGTFWEGGDKTRTPYPPEHSRVPNDAGQFGEPGGKRAGGIIS
jgi:hypothetical protein